MNPKFLLLCLAFVLVVHCRADIIHPHAPDGGKQIIYKYLEADFKPHNVLDFLGVSRIEDLTIADPYGMYGMTNLSNLALGQLLSATKCYGWKYLLMNGTNAVGLVDLRIDEKKGNALKFTALYRTNSAGEALKVAGQLPQIKKQDYELRYLNIAAILFRAVWLHGKSDDIIIPLPPTFERWNAYQPYSEGEIIKLLKPAVEQKIEMSKKYPGLPD